MNTLSTKGEVWTLITGASRGIGLHIAQEAALAGQNVILHGRDRPALESLAAQITRTAKVKTEILIEDLGQVNLRDRHVRGFREVGLVLREWISRKRVARPVSGQVRDPEHLQEFRSLYLRLLVRSGMGVGRLFKADFHQPASFPFGMEAPCVRDRKEKSEEKPHARTLTRRMFFSASDHSSSQPRLLNKAILFHVEHWRDQS